MLPQFRVDILDFRSEMRSAFLFTGLTARNMHHLKHSLSAFFTLMTAFLSWTNFGVFIAAASQWNVLINVNS
jgi:hypothetical protein